MACHEYVNHVKINQQNITYCGVNSHEQNGIAERGICTLCDRARTMLIRAMEHWPDVVTLDLWPFALCMAADIHNATTGPTGLSPEEIFMQQKSRPAVRLSYIWLPSLCVRALSATRSQNSKVATKGYI
jgi:hypothetical protein